MLRACPNCTYKDAGLHWNTASTLPPVDLPFIILKKGKEVYVYRKSYVSSSGKELLYVCVLDDEIIEGRFPWRYE